jgi:hypothetical protein
MTLLAMLVSLAAVGFTIPATPGPATAATGVTSLTSCQTIKSPGKHQLDANVTSSAPVCFSIAASNVTLILDHHTITGMGRAALIGIEVTAGHINADIMGPGTITGWSKYGISLSGSGAPSNAKVRMVTVFDNRLAGISIESSGNDVRGNVATGNGAAISNGAGIIVATGSTGNTITANFAQNNFGMDLQDGNVNCGSNAWQGNVGAANQPCIH